MRKYFPARYPSLHRGERNFAALVAMILAGSAQVRRALEAK
jgi:hypothetical protein